jgi:hypothetical protein
MRETRKIGTVSLVIWDDDKYSLKWDACWRFGSGYTCYTGDLDEMLPRLKKVAMETLTEHHRRVRRSQEASRGSS